MTLDYGSIEQHIALLDNKGYTEATLKNGYATGTIKHLLTDAHKHYSMLASLTGNEENFTLVLPGKFDNSKDQVEFRINYRLDPSQDKMRITAMSARMNEFRQLQIIGSRGEIQDAQTTYQQLSDKRTQKVINLLAARKVNPIKKLHL